MQLTSEQRGQVTVMAVDGSLDALTAPELGEALTRLIEGGSHKLVADLARMGYSSSAGLRVLLSALKLARKNGGDLRLASVQGDVNKVLTLAGVASAVLQFDDVETAVASFEAEL